MTEQQVAALEQWAKREHDYATEMGCGTDYPSVNKLRDVLALCAAWREGQETQGAAAEALAALKAGRDAAVARAEQAQKDADRASERAHINSQNWLAQKTRAEKAERERDALRDAICPEALVPCCASASCEYCGGTGVAKEMHHE